MSSQPISLTTNQLERIQLESIVRGIYFSLLEREVDQTGLECWTRLLEDGADVQYVVSEVRNSLEYQQKHGVSHRLQTNQLIENGLNPNKLFEKKPIVIVDVGAQNLSDEEHVYAPLTSKGLPHKIIGFEPLAHRIEERMADLPKNSSVTLLPVFIGDGQKHTFNINNPDATSSLFPFNREIVDKFIDLDWLETKFTESVNTITLDDALQNESSVDFLKLDIQGFELKALQHAKKTLKNTLVVHCEVSFMEIYKNQPLFSEIEQFLRGMGFELIDLRSTCHYPLSGTIFNSSRDRIGWADAVFFKKLSDDCSWLDKVKQSFIALSVYNKPSLAAWLVRDLGDVPAVNSYYTALSNKSNK